MFYRLSVAHKMMERTHTVNVCSPTVLRPTLTCTDPHTLHVKTDQEDQARLDIYKGFLKGAPSSFLISLVSQPISEAKCGPGHSPWQQMKLW